MTKFNSMTYRRDSDVFAPYGIAKPNPNANWFNYSNLDFVIKSKTRPIAWLVKNCHAHSNRELYVTELQKYFQVDVYGDCGPWKCKRQPSGYQPCWTEIERKYYFYLSFENSICRDECVNLSARLTIHWVSGVSDRLLVDTYPSTGYVDQLCTVVWRYCMLRCIYYKCIHA